MEKIGVLIEKEDLFSLFCRYDVNRSETIDYKEFATILFGPKAPA